MHSSFGLSPMEGFVPASPFSSVGLRLSRPLALSKSFMYFTKRRITRKRHTAGKVHLQLQAYGESTQTPALGLFVLCFLNCTC